MTRRSAIDAEIERARLELAALERMRAESPALTKSELGRLGGRARAAKLSDAERAACASRAGTASAIKRIEGRTLEQAEATVLKRRAALEGAERSLERIRERG